MNLERVWAWRAEVADTFTAASAMLNDQAPITPRERAVLVSARALGDSYFALAWGRGVPVGVTDEACCGAQQRPIGRRQRSPASTRSCPFPIPRCSR